MKTSVKQAWTNALRSGDYTQGKSRLLVCKEDTRQYCCLGVLVNIFENENDLKFDKDCTGSGRNHNCFLPSIVAQWSGVTPSQQEILAELNDKEFDFGLISRVIDMFPEENT
jgi:hypothetical protein